MAKTAWVCAAAGGALAAALLTTRPAHAAIHHAALVIEHSSGRVLSRCVAFAEDQITGLQLIQRSRVQYQTQSFGSLGSAICQLDGEPSSVPPGCFGAGAYWQYFHRRAGGWQPSAMAASASTLHDGDVDGWHYAGGAAQPPAALAFETVCAPAAPRPTVTSSRVAPSTVQSPSAAAPARVAVLPSPSLQEAAASASATVGTALAPTGPIRPPTPPAVGPWLLVGGAAILLIGIGAFNLWRRGP